MKIRLNEESEGRRVSGIDGFQMDFTCLDGKKIEKEPQGTPETTERNRRSVVTHRGGKRHLTASLSET